MSVTAKANNGGDKMKFKSALAGFIAFMAIASPAFGQRLRQRQPRLSDKKIHFKGVTLTLGGFLAAETVWRSNSGNPISALLVSLKFRFPVPAPAAPATMSPSAIRANSA